jgi:hypothetical protein
MARTSCVPSTLLARARRRDCEDGVRGWRTGWRPRRYTERRGREGGGSGSGGGGAPTRTDSSWKNTVCGGGLLPSTDRRPTLAFVGVVVRRTDCFLAGLGRRIAADLVGLLVAVVERHVVLSCQVARRLVRVVERVVFVSCATALAWSL